MEFPEDEKILKMLVKNRSMTIDEINKLVISKNIFSENEIWKVKKTLKRLVEMGYVFIDQFRFKPTKIGKRND